MLALLGAGPAFGAETTAAPPALIEQIKHPVSWFEWGGDFRWRHEYMDNGITVNRDLPQNIQSYQRYRARIWGQASLRTNFLFKTRLAAEPRLFFEPYPTYSSGLDWGEGVIDNLYFQWSRPASLPVVFKVGRQDVFLGNGWLMADGTPLDGSRTYFVDAARATVSWDAANTTADLFYIDHGAWNDRWLPPINHLRKPWVEQDERGAAVWLANRSLPDMELDGFFFYKHDYHPVRPAPAGSKGDLYTIGPRIVWDAGGPWQCRVEGAFQWGEKNGNDVEAYGANARLTYRFNDPWKNQVWLAYEHLSGDDPSTSKNEEFDLLWGRWPRWSELYIYSVFLETRPSQISNLNRLGPGWQCSPAPWLTTSLEYAALFADQEAPAVSALRPQIFSRRGDFRGHFLRGAIKCRFNKHWSGHLWGEVVFPGDFYTTREPLTFLRAQMMFVF